MKMNHTVLSSALIYGLTTVSGSAFAQEVAAEASAEATAEAPAEAEAEAPAEAPAEEAEEPEEEPAEESAEEATEAAAEPAEEAEDEGGASLFVFADAWAGWQSAKSGTPGGGGDVYSSNGPAGTAESGFGLSWFGTDLGYDGGMWAVNASLRFGDAILIYGTGTLGPITNAYLTLRPTEGLTLDFGTFGTIYGAEVAESWQNLNYTRGELYFNMQPFWHTGLRAEYATGGFVARALVVNDANTSVLGGGALNAGLQFGYSTDAFGLYAGALQSLKPDTTVASGGFVDTFFDVVATLNLGDLSVIGNFDMNLGYEAQQFWGVSLAAGYQFVPMFGAAIRGEFLGTSDSFLFGVAGDETLATATLTLDLKPVPETENFVVRLDGRMEFASEDVYANGDASDTTSTWGSITLGVVGYADLL